MSRVTAEESDGWDSQMVQRLIVIWLVNVQRPLKWQREGKRGGGVGSQTHSLWLKAASALPLGYV